MLLSLYFDQYPNFKERISSHKWFYLSLNLYLKIFSVSPTKQEYFENVAKIALAIRLYDFNDVKDICDKMRIVFSVVWNKLLQFFLFHLTTIPCLAQHRYETIFLFPNAEWINDSNFLVVLHH